MKREWLRRDLLKTAPALVFSATSMRLRAAVSADPIASLLASFLTEAKADGILRASGYVSAQGETVPLAVPYDDAGKPLPVERVTRYNAADLAHATARDYARFLIDARNDRGMAAPVAAERSRSQADLTPHICAGAKATTCPPWTGFCLGWQILGFPDGTTMLHTGKDAGAFTFVAIDRASGDGIVILTSSDNGWRVILPILERTGSDPKLIAFLRGQMN